jgi:transposase InsO family protein
MKYTFMETHRSEFRMTKMAAVLEVTRSGYYAWKKRGQSKRKQQDQELLQHISRIHAEAKEAYGSPRVTKQLKKEGFSCGKNRVARIMKQNKIVSRIKRRFKVTTNSRHTYPVAENLLQQNFWAQSPNSIWLSDITYIRTGEGWLYLAAIKDLASQKIVGWSMDKTISRSLTIHALEMALARQKPPSGLILHSDRGIQYACTEYQSLLRDHKIRPSMSRPGNPYDNAPMESFFSLLKREWVYHHHYVTRQEAKSSIFSYIECFYNSNRLHSSIGYRTPNEFESSFTPASPSVHFFG